MPIINATEWDLFLEQFPNSHILQTSAWGNLKSGFGWTPYYVVEGQTGAQILFRKLPLGLSIGYIPKGPVGENWQALWREVDVLCRRMHAVFLKVEPDIEEPAGPNLASQMEGFVAGTAPIQPRRTMIISLSGSEEDWLNRMKQKTRYNVRLAQKKDVVVRLSTDLESFQKLMEVTGTRDGFGVHNQTYYQRAFQAFSPKNECAILQAEFEGKPLAALMIFARGNRSWYFYGASSDEERNRMPTYLLQFEAMRWSFARGCTEYDLWGIPDAEEDDLEAHFSERSDGLWGVYRFKRGYGARIMRSVGAFDRVYNPLLYRLYQVYMKNRTESV